MCLPMVCCAVLLGPLLALFSLHRAIAPHLSPQLSPFTAMSSALEMSRVPQVPVKRQTTWSLGTL